MTQHRKPPLFAYERLRCCWCGEPIEERLKKNGEPYAVQASWHRGCVGEYRAACAPSEFYDNLAKRDGERCAVCGERPMSWEPTCGTQGQSLTTVEWHSAGRPYPVYCEVRYRPMLDVDHVVPLWKVAHLPDQERRPYFLPGNLQLICRDLCHKEKSAREAAERAQLRRAAA